MTARGETQIVIDSAGHDGEQVKLYPFLVKFDQPADCTSATVTPTTVTLTGGPQTVNLTAFQTGGDVYWMLAGTGFTTDCGASTTRVLNMLDIHILHFLTETSTISTIGKSAVTIPLSTTITYWLQGSQLPGELNGQPLSATVTWVGPFASAPEAQADPCPATPVATTDPFVFAWSKATVLQGGTLSIESSNPIPVKQTGVYRLLLSVAATAYSAEITPICESSLLVTAQ